MFSVNTTKTFVVPAVAELTRSDGGSYQVNVAERSQRHMQVCCTVQASGLTQGIFIKATHLINIRLLKTTELIPFGKLHAGQVQMVSGQLQNNFSTTLRFTYGEEGQMEQKKRKKKGNVTGYASDLLPAWFLSTKPS